MEKKDVVKEVAEEIREMPSEELVAMKELADAAATVIEEAVPMDSASTQIANVVTKKNTAIGVAVVASVVTLVGAAAVFGIKWFKNHKAAQQAEEAEDEFFENDAADDQDSEDNQ